MSYILTVKQKIRPIENIERLPDINRERERERNAKTERETYQTHKIEAKKAKAIMCNRNRVSW